MHTRTHTYTQTNKQHTYKHKSFAADRSGILYLCRCKRSSDRMKIYYVRNSAIARRRSLFEPNYYCSWVRIHLLTQSHTYKYRQERFAYFMSAKTCWSEGSQCTILSRVTSIIYKSDHRQRVVRSKHIDATSNATPTTSKVESAAFR